MIDPTEEHPYGSILGSKIAEDGTLITEIKSTDDVSVFTFNFAGGEGYGDFTFACSFMNCETKEEFAEKVYQHLTLALKDYKPNKAIVKEVIEKLEMIKQEVGTGTAMRDGCAMGVQFMIDDLIANTGRLKVMEHIITDSDDVDGDGDLNEVLGLSFFNFDFEAMKQETEETGKREFVVEAIAGIPGKYRVKVEYYEPGLLYYLERME